MVYLTKEEERILEGEEGPIKQKCMEMLVAVGDVMGAEKLVPVSSVQVAGISYRSLRDAGIEWIESLLGERVVVPTMLNPAGMDLVRWREMGVPEEFAAKQMRIIATFRKLGIMTVCSCTPYLIGNVPRLGEHIAWSESSAVCFGNSVLGARTNREGGPSALAAAIIGKTPYYGYHLTENRRPTLRVRVSAELRGESDFSCLGYWTGGIVGGGVPYFLSMRTVWRDGLKALAAGLATSGSVSLYHIEGVTPEWGRFPSEGLDMAEFSRDELAECYESLSTASPEEVDVVCIGCPHASLEEIATVSRMLRGRKITPKRGLWIFTSAGTRELASRCGYLRAIQRSGGEIYSDCCMVVAPLREMGVEAIAVNSAKAATYAPRIAKVGVVFRSLRECVDVAFAG